MFYAVILSLLKAFLSGQLSVNDLEEWFAENLQGVLDSGDQQAIRVANQFQVIFAERTIVNSADKIDITRAAYEILSPDRSPLVLTGTSTDSSSMFFEFPILPTRTLNYEYQPAAANR